MDELQEDIIMMFAPFFEALKPKEVEPENDDIDELFI